MWEQVHVTRRCGSVKVASLARCLETRAAEDDEALVR